MNNKINFNLNDYDFLISKSLEIILGLAFLIFGIWIIKKFIISLEKLLKKKNIDPSLVSFLKSLLSIKKIQPKIISDQIKAVRTDFNISAIKIGMLYDESIMKVVSNALEKNRKIPVIVDPVVNTEEAFIEYGIEIV